MAKGCGEEGRKNKEGSENKVLICVFEIKLIVGANVNEVNSTTYVLKIQADKLIAVQKVHKQIGCSRMRCVGKCCNVGPGSF